jgi:uncharacterized protein YbgA (DUF1722 family)
MVAKGEILKFKGYAEDVEESDKIYSKGDILTVVSVSEDQIEVRNDDGEAGWVLFEEVETTGQFIVVPLTTSDSTLPKEVDQFLDQELDSISEDDLLDKLEGQLDVLYRTYFDIGGMLSLVQENKLYENSRYEGKYLGTGSNAFKAFIIDQMGDLGHKKAYDYITIYRKFSAAGVTRKDMLRVQSYYKCVLVANIIRADNRDEVLDFIASHTVNEIKNFVAKYMTPEEFIEEEEEEVKSKNKTHVDLSFRLTPKDYQHFLDTISTIMPMKTVENNQNKALMYIVSQYCMMNSVQQPLERVLEHINAIYGTNFTPQEARASVEKKAKK